RSSIVSATPGVARPASVETGAIDRFATPLRLNRGALGLTALAMFLGIFLVAQWQSQIDLPADTSSRPALTRDTIQRLESEQQQLKQQIAQLRAQNATQQQSVSKNASALAQLGNAVAQQRAIAGTVPLRGSGPEIVLDDSTSRTPLPATTADDYIV